MAKVTLGSIQNLQNDVKTRLELRASIKGYNDFKKELKKFEPGGGDMRRAMDREIRGVLKPVAAKAQSFVPERPLSGWRLGSDRVGTARMPDWDQGEVRKNIKVRQGGRRARGSATQSAWKISNLSAAGSVLELAGKRNDGNPPMGHVFIKALTLYHGNPSRLIYRAWDEAGGKKKITAEVFGIVKLYESKLKRGLKSAKD